MGVIKGIVFLSIFVYTTIWAVPVYGGNVSQTLAEKKISGYSGSGFFITPNVIVTCNHVISGASSIEIVYNNGIKLTAVVIGSDVTSDLALLRVTGMENVAVSPLMVGDSDSMREGDRVYAVGFPLPLVMGMGAKMSEGIISSVGGLQGDLRIFQVSTPVQPGNSGGPLLNDQAQVVGVVSSGLNPIVMMKEGIIPQNVNYAVKINNISNLVHSASLNLSFHEPLSSGSLRGADVMDIAKGAVAFILVMK